MIIEKGLERLAREGAKLCFIERFRGEGVIVLEGNSEEIARMYKARHMAAAVRKQPVKLETTACEREHSIRPITLVEQRLPGVKADLFAHLLELCQLRAVEYAANCSVAHAAPLTRVADRKWSEMAVFGRKHWTGPWWVGLSQRLG
jgi:hypothetical protein